MANKPSATGCKRLTFLLNKPSLQNP